MMYLVSFWLIPEPLRGSVVKFRRPLRHAARLFPIPAAPDGAAVPIPIVAGAAAHRRPVLPEPRFKIGVPCRVLPAVVSARPVSEARGRLHILPIGLAERRRGLLPGRLPDR